jgi:L,D-transpeptidase ErfK/SrfK
MNLSAKYFSDSRQRNMDRGITSMRIKFSVSNHSKMEKPGLFARVALLVIAAGYAIILGVCAEAATFALPGDGNTIVGQVQVVTDIGKNTLFDIARHYDLGYKEIVEANPGVSVWVPDQNQKIVVPTEFILPPKPWVGIVINIPQRRVYYFPKPKKGKATQVMTFPLGISRPGWPTPLGQTRIIAKFRDPSWIVPKSIQKDHRKQGEPQFPSYFPPGPDNPMGMLAMETGFSEIFIHGTNEPWGVGMRVSHGCFHLYPEDAAHLFPILPVGTPVRIINDPYVVGVRGGQLYMAAFKPIADYPTKESPLTRAVATVTRLMPDRLDAPGRPSVDWDRAIAIAQAERPVPEPISPGTSSLQEIIEGIRPEAYHYPPYGKDANNGLPPKALQHLNSTGNEDKPVQGILPTQ